MNLTDELKAKIDSMDYRTLLTKCRFAKTGDEFWQGESGEYAMKELSRKQRLHDNPSAVSKEIGWSNE